jgi:hypothetical protein
LPALPFLAFPVAFALETGAVRRLAAGLVAYSVTIMLLVVATNPLFDDPYYTPGAYNPLIGQTLRDIQQGVWQNNWANVFGLRGAFSLVPLAVCAAFVASNIARRQIPATSDTGSAVQPEQARPR